ncbi:T9SS type A sorting domain-containing protein [Winogradskyella eckloniae]|uniref:T9SS type A sorting domain-containing protein n=1 Tax=Winogradskyella eckloniae TaxID=1089306 RepID=UPI0015679B9F|nr:T9SS type A sorting domain-containing protein [Winogradskyella eckloniae]NRD20681.1 T9SS type A sorting domain-containing protein [Winogradskyella eckloniae]
MVKKINLLILFTFIYIIPISSQQVWYENASSTEHISFNSVSAGVFTTNETNPEINTINSNATVSKFVRDGNPEPTISFDLTNPITDLTSYTISLKAYTSLATSEFNATNTSIRLYLRNSNLGDSDAIFEELLFSEGETWASFTFDFNNESIPANVLLEGGYDQIQIELASEDTTALTSTYYFDTISGYSEQTIPKAQFLSGSWGMRFNLHGGIRLDNTDHYDWVIGAQQIVDNLPSVGHIITNFTHPAHGYFYTLRDNAYVDIANEIHPGMVPTIENEQIILDVINVFKTAGKKVILYVNGAGPSVIQGNVDATEAGIITGWENYYNTNFAGDEGLAWQTLARGFFERFSGLVDGYWIDNVSNLPGDLDAFIAMIRDVHPEAAIATNLTKSFIKDEDGNNIYVDSDSTTDEDPTDYRVFFLEANDPYTDFTAGHPTPLGQGAPPNSWAYEEFSFPLVTENPWSSYNGVKQALKHYFVPIRQQWSVASADLVFEIEQAYRFVRTFTDPGATMTWSTTITDGYITADEMAIMQEINNRMVQSPKPDFIPYTRPEGAYLVGETLSIDSETDFNQIVLYPNPVKDSFRLTKNISSAIIYNIEGQQILKFNQNEPYFNVSSLKEGVYFVKAYSSNNDVQAFKIIKK